MKSIILKSIRMLLIMTVITGIVYPLIITAIANSGFKEKAQGSLVYKDGRVIGSKLIGQKFDTPGYFWPRPSVTGYNTMPSGASNLGPTSKQLQKLVRERAAAFIAANGLKENRNIPVELLTASGSGLDPDVSPDAALMQ